MEIIRSLGLFLLCFGLIVFGAKFLLSKSTKKELVKMKSTPPAFYASHNKALMRFIVILSILLITIYFFFYRF
tara:strand:- start:2610 stop:2828 length:219 start_codon:yes stop_codon:yes gene_type:complete